MTTETQEALSAEELHIGDKVEVTGGFGWSSDWKDVHLWVAGIDVVPVSGIRSYSLSEHWPPTDRGDVTTDFPREHLRLFAAARSRALPEAATGGGLRDTLRDMEEDRREILQWTGSLFLADERKTGEAEEKGDLYEFLCRLASCMSAYRDALAALAATGEKTEGWRPISEHDGSPEIVDLWRDGERLIGYAWDGRRWSKPVGYPVFTNVLTKPPTHFMPLPAPPAPEVSA